MPNIDQLESIVSSSDFDEDSKKRVQELRERFEHAIAAEDLANHPAVKPYIEFLKMDIEQCKEELSENPLLDESTRRMLFERKRQARSFLTMFEDTKEKVEADIKQELDVAKTQEAS